MGHITTYSRSSARTALGLCALAFFLLAFASSASAAPSHPRKEALDIPNLNHACGAAVDSKGDVYASSAGESKVKVYDASHILLTSISNANEPCGLAVNSKGELYVSEQATGNVVRYKPNAYPLTGSPTYGAAEPIDSSGEAKGIAVDRFDDRLYVARGDGISVYSADGLFGASNEVQRVLPFGASGGTFTLSFEGQTTTPLAWNATHAEVDAALGALSTIGAGNVSVAEGESSWEGRDHLITFEGALANTDVQMLKADTSGLVGSGFALEEKVKGYSGQIGKGSLTDATGVAAYTYKLQSDSRSLFVFVADAATDQVKIFSGSGPKDLKLRRTIGGVDQDADPDTPDQSFGFGPAGAHLAADPGNEDAGTKGCAALAEQACTAGHFLVYDDANDAVDEFDASGEFLDQIKNAAFSDAEPTGFAVERSGTANDGTIYVTAGAGAGAKLLAFGPLAKPDRASLPALSHVLAKAAAVATDSYGNVYVSAKKVIHVYDPKGNELTSFEDPNTAYDLAVDSTGKIYVLDGRFGSVVEGVFFPEERLTYYTPSAYPPVSGTTYTRHEPEIFTNTADMKGVTVDPRNDHVFLLWSIPGATGAPTAITEFSPAPGSTKVRECGKGVELGNAKVDIDVYGKTGNLYITSNAKPILVVNCGPEEGVEEEFVNKFSGSGCPSAAVGSNPGIAIDQSNGHVIEFAPGQTGNSAREYDSAGSCVAQFGTFSSGGENPYKVAIDNSCALHDPPLTEQTTPTCAQFDPSNGNVYVAYDGTNNSIQPNDLTAFGPLSYGEVPAVSTGIASGLGSGVATLNGTVDPRGFDLEECRFEYLTDAEYKQNEAEEDPLFEGAISQDCDETLASIGHGSKPVAVHADVTGVEPTTTRYRYRLLAESRFGEGEGKAGLFGPPVLTVKSALPVLYDEATLRAEIDPSGLLTSYRFEYGKEAGEYDQSTSVSDLAAGDGSVEIEVPVTGFAEGTEYHFRLVAENEANTVEGPDQTLVTLKRASAQECANAEFRTGLSTFLPDCRAYELVTPAETRGLALVATTRSGSGEGFFNSSFVAPRGEGAGDGIAYGTGGLPGFDGTGRGDGFRAHRGAGAHPADGWTTELYSLSFAQVGGSTNDWHGISPDQGYWLMDVGGIETPGEETFPEGNYLRVPTGVADPGCSPDPQLEFELVGCGGLGEDLAAQGRYVSAGGTHVIFASKAHLEEEAAPAGTEAIYDRMAGDSNAEVISVKPDGSPFGAGENAAYVASTEDGSATVFKVGGALYLHREGATAEIAAAPSTFAGVSEDGLRVFYADSTNGGSAAGLFACDVEAGPCVGTGSHAPTEIASSGIFVNVSPDGSHAFFTSKDALTGPGEENDNGEHAEAGENNLYAWDGTDSSFLAILDPQDLVSFGEQPLVSLNRWTAAIQGEGRAFSPTRATPDGEFLVFQSYARLTPYDNEDNAEIYRTTEAGELSCVSCDPSNAPASADAWLQRFQPRGVVNPDTLIPNLTDNGQAVFFQSNDRLLPEDANDAMDVYEWKAQGAGDCTRPGGCLALISSGQGESPSYLYGMTADGNDVFIETPERLVAADIPGSPSLYDARVGGGIPDPPVEEGCQGDACQGRGSIPPGLPSPASTGASDGNVVQVPSRCGKGKHRVKGRCVKKHRKRKGHGKPRRANHQGRSHR